MLTQTRSVIFNISTAKESYLYGDCNIFAYALSKIKPFHVAALVEVVAIEGKEYRRLIHAFCTKDKSIEIDTVVYDAMGARTFGDIVKDYCCKIQPEYTVGICEKTEDVLTFGYYSEGDLDVLVSKATEYIQNQIEEYET